MPETETSKLVALSKDRVFSKIVREDGELVDDPLWVMSSPVPGTILKTWEIYHGVQIVLSKADSGNYQIFRSINLINYSIVHDHDTEIYDIFWINDGRMVFCATDGWFETVDSGLTWPQLVLAPLPAKAFSYTQHVDGSQKWIVYGIDQKVYLKEIESWYDPALIAGGGSDDSSPSLPWHDSAFIAGGGSSDSSWLEVLDTTTNNSGRWYPAMAGSSVGVLVGAGPYLFRALGEDPTTWTLIKTFDGTVKSIRISDFSRNPTFYIVVEMTDGDHLYSTVDLGDSCSEILGTRIDPNMAIESIVPTLGNTTRTTFAVVGRRTRDVDAPFTYKIVGQEG